jgi:hypothetical protein
MSTGEVKNKDSFQNWAVVAEFRKLLLEQAPDAKETTYRGAPAFKKKAVLVVVNPTQTGVTFSFARGAEFDDKFGLLKGPSVKSRVVKIKSLSDADWEAMKYYISKALELDEK